jgi:hypothetical protein
MTSITRKQQQFLLTCGILAGPTYILVSAVEILTREGFDITRHPWSVLSNGELGWIHIVNFLVTGLLTALGAVGLRQSLKGEKGGTWGPILLAVYGLCLVVAGIFKADPVDGFPPGTPLGPPTTISTSGMLHALFGLIGFLALVSACIVFFRHFRSVRQDNFAWFSLATGVYFLLGFLSIIVLSGIGSIGPTIALLAFTAAVILSWVWYSLLSWRVARDLRIKSAGQPVRA